MDLTPLCSCRRAQQSPAIRSRIGPLVVEESDIELWERHRTSKTTPTIMVSDFMGSDATETSFIPLSSWRRAQQSPAIRFRIGAMVVEESVIEFWDRQDSIQPCNFMNKDCGGMDCTPLGSCRRAQQPPAIRFRIGPVVMEGSDIKHCECQGMYKENSHKGQRSPEF